jgi:formaldehyde-activating enzyme involved in methanogenesis
MSVLPTMALGESFIGEGAEAAYINTILGRRNGPVAAAWATALTTPSQGHTPFVAVVKPGLPAKPLTLFVNKAPIASSEHGPLTENHREAMLSAIRASLNGLPLVSDVLAARDLPSNPFYTAPAPPDGGPGSKAP